MDKDLCKQLNHPETKNTANQDLTLWQKIKVLAAVNVFFSSPVICYGAIAIAEKIATGTISKEAQFRCRRWSNSSGTSTRERNYYRIIQREINPGFLQE